jgi:hypothetical protein
VPEHKICTCSLKSQIETDFVGNPGAQRPDKNWQGEWILKLAFFVKQRKLLITKVVIGKFPADYVSA